MGVKARYLQTAKPNILPEIFGFEIFGFIENFGFSTSGKAAINGIYS
jgi:hypothetical protein